MDSPCLRILFLTPQLPFPPRQGTSIRNYHLMRRLARNHVLDLLSFLAPGQELTADSPLHKICREVHAIPQPVRTVRARAQSTLFSRQPDMALRLYSPAMLELLDRQPVESYDIVQIEGIEMAPYGLRLARAAARHPHRPALVFDNHNCEYLLQKRNALSDLRNPRRWIAAAYSLVQWQKLRSYERQVCNASDLLVAVSEPDRSALMALGIDTRAVVVPNGIETNAYADLRPQVGMAARHAVNIVFTGKMDYRPNIDAAIWFGSQVFPAVKSRASDASFQIVGQQPHPRLDVLRRIDGIEITGAVPDVRPYLAGASVFVIPMRVGGGTRLKALEAMAAGLPIVSTSLGVEGIPVQGGRELLLADSPSAFAEAVLHLLEDQRAGAAISRELGRAARQFVTDHYDWQNLVPVLERSYRDLLADKDSDNL